MSSTDASATRPAGVASNRTSLSSKVVTNVVKVSLTTRIVVLLVTGIGLFLKKLTLRQRELYEGESSLLRYRSLSNARLTWIELSVELS